MAIALITHNVTIILLNGTPMYEMHSKTLTIFIWNLNANGCNSWAYQPHLLSGFFPQLVRKMGEHESNPPLTLGGVCCPIHSVEDQPCASIFVVESSTVVFPHF
jgi:hypothetical protein